MIETRLPYAQDGWRAWLHESVKDEHLAVWLTLTFHEHELSSQEVYREPGRSDVELGRVSRMLQLWKAIAAYLNSGGDPYALPEIAGVASQLTAWTLPGYSLLETTIESGYVTHTFRFDDDPSRILSWQEDVICEELTASQLGEYLTSVEEADDCEDLFDSEGSFTQKQNLLGL